MIRNPLKKLNPQKLLENFGHLCHLPIQTTGQLALLAQDKNAIFLAN